jgi:hypothetical protein
LQNVFIAPAGARNVDDSRGWVPQYKLPDDTVQALLSAGKAVLLDVSNGQVRDVTPSDVTPK